MLDVSSAQLDRLAQTALLHFQAGRLHEAEQLCARILNSHPNHIDALHLFAAVLTRRGQYPAAEKLFRKVLAARPNSAEVHDNLGSCLRSQHNPAEALACFQRTLALQPDFPNALINLADIAGHQGDLDQALPLAQRALQLDPHSPSAHNALGIALYRSGRLEEALASYHRALDLSPNFAEAHSNIASILLLRGNYPDGFREYHWRLRTQDRRASQLPGPQWSGQNLAGKTLFLYTPQGLGDEIQFSRFLPLLADTGAKILFESQPELTRLFRPLPAIHQLLTQGDPLPPFDFHSPLDALPRLLNTTLDNLPPPTPLRPELRDIHHWRRHLQPHNHKRTVGLAWAGNPHHPNDRNRSIPFPLLAPLFDLPNIQFITLQKNPPPSPTPPPATLLDCTSDLLDLADTAALIENLDLLITVDTALAHLAGSLQKPALLLLPFIPDWRWLLHRPDSPWYPTLHLLRQQTPNNWPPIITQIINHLTET